MIDWDDVRYFLAAARGGSVRAAARRLGVNHATVLRRIAQLEERLGAQMFEKLPSGYRLTAAGEEVLELATQMETSSLQLETRVFGRDQSARGLLRVTLTPMLATHLLMPDLAEFARLHPDIEFEILSSGELANLTNREADWPHGARARLIPSGGSSSACMAFRIGPAKVRLVPPGFH